MGDITDDLIAGRQINFLYISPDGKGDRQFFARSHFVPRIGEHLVIEPNEKKVVVKDVYYKWVQLPGADVALVPNVVLRDADRFPGV